MKIPEDVTVEENIEAARKWIEDAASAIKTTVTNISTMTGGFIRKGAFRSVVVTFENRTPFQLLMTHESRDGGIWTDERRPPNAIPAYSVATWSSESQGIATGTEAEVGYALRADPKYPKIGEFVTPNGDDCDLLFTVHWSNPAGGKNSVWTRWDESGKEHVYWDRLHLPYPDDISSNQAHHHWVLTFDPKQVDQSEPDDDGSEPDDDGGDEGDED